MAEHINIEKDEYDFLTDKILTVHQQELEEINRLSDKVTQLVEPGGDFYSDEISRYVKEVINIMDSHIVPVIEQKFALTEQEINTYIDVVNNIDTLL